MIFIIARAFAPKLDHTVNMNRHRISHEQAKTLVESVRDRLKVDIRLRWSSNSSAIYYEKGKPVKVPRGLVQHPGMTTDGLALILVHESAHARGKHLEADADYWAARHGLRRLWGKEGFSRDRALKAAQAALRSQFSEEFSVNCRKQKIEINATGYPTVQSRWNIFKAGILKRTKPPTGQRARPGKLVLFSRREAAAYLGVNEHWFTLWARTGNGPVEINFVGKARYIKDDLDRFHL